MASAAFGKLEAFQEGEETIAEYLERVELYFAANDVAEEKKVPMLLSVIGAKTYSVLRSLVPPATPTEEITCLLRRERRWSLPHWTRLAKAHTYQLERNRSDHAGHYPDKVEVAVRQVQ